MSDSYNTISNYSEGIYKEKGSKFLAYAIPVISEAAAGELIAQYKKEHHAARHHCYAYRLGVRGEVYKANDDNEPTYTAGKPILGQIDSFGLTNILIIVVRYFGGTLLGKGGLVNAYKSAAADALNNAIIAEKTLNDYFNVTCRYEDMNRVLKILGEEGLKPDEQNFEVECVLKVGIRKSLVTKILNKLKLINSIKIDYIYTA